MSDAIAAARQYTEAARARLLKTLSFVPEERMDWSPAPSARSARAVAIHAGLSNGMMVRILRGEQLPATTPADVHARYQAALETYRTREAVAAMIEETTGEVLAALEAMPPERIASTIESPIMTAPMTFFMNLPGRHMDNHAAQIDYLQTCWADAEFHF